MLFAALFTAISLPVLTSAGPFTYPRSMNSVSSHAHMLALDERSGTVIAYDIRGRNLGTFPASSIDRRDDPGKCFDISADDVQKRTLLFT